MARRRTAVTIPGPDDSPESLLAQGLADIKDAGGKLEPPADAELNDIRVSEDLAAAMGGKFCWTLGLGWLRWDTRRWMPTTDVSAVSFARKWVTAQRAQTCKWAAKHPGKAGEEAIKAWHRYQYRAGLEAIVSLARGPLERLIEDFDNHPHLLNAKNGVVDLRTGMLGEHDPALLLTKVTMVDYDPDAAHEDFTAALEAIPADIREWYQTRIGQAATGYTPDDDIMLIQQGGGSNGKSTMMVCLRAALRDYYLNVPHRALLGDAKAHSTELADFRGARCAVLEELPEGKNISVTRVKMLIGTEQVTARKVFKDDIAFDASHTLIINTNPLPQVSETDHGTWRRLALMIWPIKWLKVGEVPQAPNERVGDPKLRNRLKAGKTGQHEAILAWIVEGSVRWFEDEMVLPPLPARIENDTETWRSEIDLVLAYWNDRLVKDTSSHIASADLYEDMKFWLTQHGHYEWSESTVGSRFGSHDTTASNRAVKKKMRDREGASRPPEGGFEDLPVQYQAWLGVRFRDKRDDAETLTEMEKDEVGTAGTGDSKLPQDILSHREGLDGLSQLSQPRKRRRQTTPRPATQSDSSGFSDSI
jgi:putative DNA primase/helicase